MKHPDCANCASLQAVLSRCRRAKMRQGAELTRLRAVAEAAELVISSMAEDMLGPKLPPTLSSIEKLRDALAAWRERRGEGENV